MSQASMVVPPNRKMGCFGALEWLYLDRESKEDLASAKVFRTGLCHSFQAGNLERINLSQFLGHTILYFRW